MDSDEFPFTVSVTNKHGHTMPIGSRYKTLAGAKLCAKRSIVDHYSVGIDKAELRYHIADLSGAMVASTVVGNFHMKMPRRLIWVHHGQ